MRSRRQVFIVAECWIIVVCNNQLPGWSCGVVRSHEPETLVDFTIQYCGTSVLCCFSANIHCSPDINVHKWLKKIYKILRIGQAATWQEFQWGGTSRTSAAPMMILLRKKTPNMSHTECSLSERSIPAFADFLSLVIHCLHFASVYLKRDK